MPLTTRPIIAASALLGAALLTAPAVLAPPIAHACGGLFCDASNPVNQSAERIIFVDNGDDTTTAAIQIMYEGPPDDFAWVLPVADIPNPDDDIRVSSNLALDRLQQQTNPRYQLNRRVEGTCADNFDGPNSADDGFGGDGDSSGDGDGDGDGGGVIIEASGAVGPFDYELISVRGGDNDVVDVATEWLADNQYDLAGGEDLLRPYLENGMKLLCVRLSSGNDAGSIRPLMVTYAGDTPSIPIRPTAVAANDDMGIMAFVGGAARAIPKNYGLLELNDALIDWYNPNDTYNEVVIRAADEAMGHGFVTEYAAQSSDLSEVIVFSWEREDFQSFQSQNFGSDSAMLDASLQWSEWDGFLDAIGASATLPAGTDATDIANCPACYLDGADAEVIFDRNLFRTQLYELVIRPMFDTDELVMAQAWMTRLYTTMSADEMTEDPIFDFNPDMGEVDNLHQADLIIECSPELQEFEAPFRVELPSGTTVRGTEQGVWPVELSSDQPAALRISQASTSGDPTVLVDNVETIEQALSVNGGGGGGDGGGADGGTAADGEGTGGDASAGLCSCRAVGTGHDGSHGGALALLALVGALGRLRRRPR